MGDASLKGGASLRSDASLQGHPQRVVHSSRVMHPFKVILMSGGEFSFSDTPASAKEQRRGNEYQRHVDEY